MKVDMLERIVNELNDVRKIRGIASILDNVSDKDIKLLLEELKNCDYHELACGIVAVFNSHNRKSIEEQIQLMRQLKNCDYHEYVYEIAVNLAVLQYRSTEEQIRLMEELKNCGYDKATYDIAVNPVMLEKSIEEQLEQMKKAHLADDKIVRKPIMTEHSKNMKKIKKLDHMKEYINQLKSQYGSTADIKANTKVLEYIPSQKE